jgi:hypothetical protein
MLKIKCIKSVYKSTHKKWVFNRGKIYDIYEESESHYIILIDNNILSPFSISKSQLYYMGEYYMGEYYINDGYFILYDEAAERTKKLKKLLKCK